MRTRPMRTAPRKRFGVTEAGSGGHLGVGRPAFPLDLRESAVARVGDHRVDGLRYVADGVDDLQVGRVRARRHQRGGRPVRAVLAGDGHDVRGVGGTVDRAPTLQHIGVPEPPQRCRPRCGLERDDGARYGRVRGRGGSPHGPSMRCFARRVAVRRHARDRRSTQMKYGAPTRAIMTPAGSWAGAASVRPRVSATQTSSPPSSTAVGPGLRALDTLTGCGCAQGCGNSGGGETHS